MPRHVQAWTRLRTFHLVDLDRAVPIERTYAFDLAQSRDMEPGWGDQLPGMRAIWGALDERAILESSLVPFLPVRPRLTWPTTHTPYVKCLWECVEGVYVFEWTFSSF